MPNYQSIIPLQAGSKAPQEASQFQKILMCHLKIKLLQQSSLRIQNFVKIPTCQSIIPLQVGSTHIWEAPHSIAENSDAAFQNKAPLKI